MTNPTTAETLWNQIFLDLTLGEPRACGGAQVFPLHRPNGHSPDYVLLDDLLDTGTAEVVELDHGGHVPTLAVRNRSDFDALLLDGTELRGAKQNRMVNITIVVGRHSETEIPVSCVEQGRWSYRSERFASARRTVGGRLRRWKTTRVAENLAASREAQPGQGEVWDRVAACLSEGDVRSETAALNDAFEGYAEEIDSFVRQLDSLDGCGAVVVIDGHPVSVDLFDCAATFAKVWPALVRGLALDAVLERRRGSRSEPGRISSEGVRGWLAALRERATLSRHDIAGVAEHWTVAGPEVAGGLTLHRNRILHLAVSAQEP